MGGYRGEVSCLTAIVVDVESDESKSINEPAIFWWKPVTLDNSENGAIARSYHTANFIDEDTGSKDGIHHIHVNKLYIFGGFDSKKLALWDFTVLWLYLQIMGCTLRDFKGKA